ncbi:MAG: DNA repair protein RadA, partial [Anaerovoracaceae bacterium]
IVLGEIGLTGDLRGIRNEEKIINEANRMGFEKVILPTSKKPASQPAKNCKLVFAKTLREAILEYS